jgi:hypothetical protein
MARLTVKDIVSQTSMELGLSLRPVTTATSSSDQDIVQMVALLSNVADEVLLEEPYRTILGDGVWVHDPEENPVPRPQGDDDTILFDGRLAINGLKWRFLQAKGLEFGEQMRDYTNRLNKLAGSANGYRVIDLYEDEGRIV